MPSTHPVQVDLYTVGACPYHKLVSGVSSEVGDYIGVKQSEKWSLQSNATHSINQVAAMQWKPGDIVITSDREHTLEFGPLVAIERQRCWNYELFPVLQGQQLRLGSIWAACVLAANTFDWFFWFMLATDGVELDWRGIGNCL